MQENKVSSVRAVFENMSTEQLDEILNRELHADPPDANAIRLILDILREREKDMPIEVTPRMLETYEKYKRDVAQISERSKRPKRIRGMLVRLVSSAAVLVVAFALMIPQEAKAGGIRDWLMRVTEDVLEFFTPMDTESRIVEYEFKTDNPGLQQVYDAVVELGVDFPVVPMWLPDGAEFQKISMLDSPARTRLAANFNYANSEIVYNVEIYENEVAHSFEKDESQIKIKEIEGTRFTVMRNNNMWTAVWEIDNIKCFITIDCQEEDLYRILKSIYVMEE